MRTSVSVRSVTVYWSSAGVGRVDANSTTSASVVPFMWMPARAEPVRIPSEAEGWRWFVFWVNVIVFFLIRTVSPLRLTPVVGRGIEMVATA